MENISLDFTEFRGRTQLRTVKLLPRDGIFTAAIIDRLTSIKVINTDILKLQTSNDYHYNPSDYVTRAELAVIIYGFLGGDKIEGNARISDGITYKDVPLSSWAYGYITAASNSGAFSKADEFFYPDNCVTYAEAMKSILNVCGYAPLAKTCGKDMFGYVSLSNILELTDGIGKFKPIDNITKSDLAVLLNNSLDLLNIVADGIYEDGSAYCFVMDGTSYFDEDGERCFYEKDSVLTPITALTKVNVEPRRLIDPLSSEITED